MVGSYGLCFSAICLPACLTIEYSTTFCAHLHGTCLHHWCFSPILIPYNAVSLPCHLLSPLMINYFLASIAKFEIDLPPYTATLINVFASPWAQPQWMVCTSLPFVWCSLGFLVHIAGDILVWLSLSSNRWRFSFSVQLWSSGDWKYGGQTNKIDVALSVWCSQVCSVCTYNVSKVVYLSLPLGVIVNMLYMPTQTLEED